MIELAALLLLSIMLLVLYAQKLQRVSGEYKEIRNMLRHVLATYSRRLQTYDVTIESIRRYLEEHSASIKKLRGERGRTGLPLERLEKAVTLSLDASKKALSQGISQREEFRKLESKVLRMEENRSKLRRIDELEKEFMILKSAYDAHAAGEVTQPMIEEKVGVQTLLAGGEEVISRLTQTELQVLTILGGQGAKTSRDIEKALGKTREHTARLMKKLYLEGYVERDSQKLPYIYRVNERIRSFINRRV